MSTSEDYRRFAGACLELAGAVEDEQTRAVLIQMAQVWFRLAVEREKEEDTETAD
jgi:predicted RNase H-like HicB family nuclease